MKVIKIKNSYNVWDIVMMRSLIKLESLRKYNVVDADKKLNRTYRSMYIEWYLHNIGYYLTLPFIKHEYINFLNKRFKDVDLEEH